MASTTPFAPAAVLVLAAAVRNDGTTPVFCYGTDETVLEGGEAVACAVKFPDGVTWAVRVPIYSSRSLEPAYLISYVEAQAKMLQRLDKSGFRWSPKLIHYDAGSDNAINHPYFILSWFPGTALEWTDAVPSKRQDREKILRQFADIQLELAECTKDLRPGHSAKEFLAGVVDGKVMRGFSKQEPLFTVRDCLVHRALIRHAVDDSLDSDPCVFSVSHENLAAHSIIVDAEYNITGIVDWSFARNLPLQLAARLPRFLVIEPDEPRVTAPDVPNDIAEFAKQYLEPSETLVADRSFITSYLAFLSADVDLPERSSLAKTMQLVLSEQDANWRYLIIEACFSRGLHAWLARRDWLLHGTRGAMSALPNTSLGELVRDEAEKFLEDESKEESVNRADFLEAMDKQVRGI